MSATTERVKIFTVTLIRITGPQLHAARVLVGLSREKVAERAGLCRHSIRKWETSSHAIPGAMYTHLCRVVSSSARAQGSLAIMGSPCSAQRRSRARLFTRRLQLRRQGRRGLR
jgi:transcriptional regulator with XRE-family HTH domain